MQASDSAFFSRHCLTVAVFAATGLLVPVSANATTITVDTVSDAVDANSDCSLREAVKAANTDAAVDACPAGSGADTIVVTGGATYMLSVAGTDEDASDTGDLDLLSQVTIKSDSDALAVVDAKGIDRVLQVGSAGIVRLKHLEIRGGQVNPGNGGGILNGGDLTVIDATVTANRADGDDGGLGGGGQGGGIYNAGTLTLKRASLDNNQALGGAGQAGNGRGSGGGGGAGLGGAVFNASGATLDASDSIFEANASAGGDGGAAGRCNGVGSSGNGGGAGGAAGGNYAGGGDGGFGGGGGAGGKYAGGGDGGFGGGGGGAGAKTSGGTNRDRGSAGFGGGRGGSATYSCGASGGGGAGLGGAIFDDGGTVSLDAVRVQNNSATPGSSGRGYYAGSAGRSGHGWGGGVFTNGGSVAVSGRSVINQNNPNTTDTTSADCGWNGNAQITIGVAVDTTGSIGCATAPSTQVTPVASGNPNCADGGLRIDTGVDDGAGAGSRHDGTLEDAEIDTTNHVCNGAVGQNGADGANALVNLTSLSAGDANCADGGQQIEAGLDNGDGGATADDATLDTGEVDTTSFVCNGQDGADGDNALNRYQALSAGNATCPSGGQLLQSGLDNGDGGEVAGDGALRPGEVDAEAAVCNGTAGQNGYSSLVTTTSLSVGDPNCANGGVQFDAGVDNGDGGATAGDATLADGEIDSTSFVCNGADGADGADSLGLSTPLSSGDANCPHGGTQLDFGLDNADGGATAGDGILDTGEIDSTAYVCNGAPAARTLVEVSDEPAGDNCEAGGQRIDAGVDDDGDEVLADVEIETTTYVCDGSDGRDGADGQDGVAGQNGEPGDDGQDAAGVVARTRAFVDGEDACAGGGFMLEVGRDVDGNGELSDAEVDTSSPVCHGADGDRGPEGGCSTSGANRMPGSLAAFFLLALGAVARRRRQHG